jgi:general secretion pathway protein L
VILGAGELARWTATPAAAPHAERWLGTRVAVLTEAERAMLACRGATNLRQYELAPRHRGMRALREAGRRFMLPEWRAVRWGLGALLAMQLVGLNAYAWHQERALERKREAMNETLRAAYPGVRTVLDAPLQMQRETERARALGGRLARRCRPRADGALRAGQADAGRPRLGRAADQAAARAPGRGGPGRRVRRWPRGGHAAQWRAVMSPRTIGPGCAAADR